MNIPASPNEMPSEWHNSPNQVRNCVVTLDQYSRVDIHWERDYAASDAAGENVGEWNVIIENGPRRVTVNHPELTNALWFVTEVSNAQSIAAYHAREESRKAALAKLTPEDRKLLGV